MADYDPTYSPIDPTTSPPSGTGSESSNGVIVTNVSRTLESVSSHVVGDYPLAFNAAFASYWLVGSFAENITGVPSDTMRGRIRVTLNTADVDDANYIDLGDGRQGTFSFDGIVLPGDTFASIQLLADNNNYGWKSIVLNQDDEQSSSALIYFKTAAVDAYLYLPTVSSIGQSSAIIACLFYPNTYHSRCSALLQYKATASGTWITAGIAAPCSGYAQNDMGRDLTGLSYSTSYDVRLALSRDVAGGTVQFYSPILTFSTLASSYPTPTTLAASSIGEGSAVLNGSFTTITGYANLPYTFLYGTSSPPTTETAPTQETDVPALATVPVNKSISGLTSSTLYYFRLKSSPIGAAVELGSILSFTTTQSQEDQAKEDDMLPIQTFDRKYKTLTTIYFVVPTISPDSNTFYTGAAVWGTSGESQKSKNGAAWADTTNAPAASTAGGGLFKLQLEAAELDSDEVFIKLHDVGAAVRDVLLRVRTHMELGSVDIDSASGSKTNSSALKLTGYGTGAGLEAIGGATGVDIDALQASNFLHSGTGGTQHTSSTTQMLLGTTSSTTADIYNGCLVGIIAGTGAGQSRLIKDYVAGTYPSGATNDGNREITVDTAWVTTPINDSVYVIMPGPRTWEQGPTAELTAVPSTSSGYGAFLQLLFQRFAFKVTQDSTTQKWYKADGTTELLNRPVSDTGGVQTVGTLATT
jgi:hypothetical protein